jgi:hypothetical protein
MFTKLISLSGHVCWGQEKLFEEKQEIKKSCDTVPLRFCYAKSFEL